MNYLNSLILKAGTAVAALALTAGMAHAGDMTFNMPFDAVWSGVHLTPGPYTMSEDRTSAGDILLHVSGNGKHSLIPLRRTNAKNYQGSDSSLKIQNIDGTQYVSEFQCASTNSTTSFHVPKSTHLEMARSHGAGTTSLALSLK